MTDYESIRVHLASSDVPLPPAAPKQYRTVFMTITLTADDPVQPLLPASDDREIAYVQALDNDITLGNSRGTAPNGAVIPHTNLGPYPVKESGSVFVAMTASTDSRVSVTAVYRR